MALQPLNLPTSQNSYFPCCKNSVISVRAAALHYPVAIRTSIHQSRFLTISRPHPLSKLLRSYEEEGLVEDLRVPDHWLDPSTALQESEWLRATLHKWLDDEYCPETTNIEISKVAARSYYESLVEQRADLGEILLKMARDLESISYQESFHGAFSSANAAISLISQRIEQN